jgi:hypothetical protein
MLNLERARSLDRFLTGHSAPEARRGSNAEVGIILRQKPHLLLRPANRIRSAIPRGEGL